MRWTIDLHNEVNLVTNKPVLSYEEAFELYTQKQFPLLSLLSKAIILILILIGIYVLLRRKNL